MLLEYLTAFYLLRGDYANVQSISTRMLRIHPWWPPFVESLLPGVKGQCTMSESSADTVLNTIPEVYKIWMRYSLADCYFNERQIGKYENMYGWRAAYYPKSLYLHRENL